MKKLALQLNAISVFKSVKENETTMNSFSAFASADELDLKLYYYGEFVNSLSPYNCNFSNFLKDKIFQDENKFIQDKASKITSSKELEFNTTKELELFSSLTDITFEMVEKEFNALGYDGYLPHFTNTHIDFVKVYMDRVENVDKYGYGIFSAHKMFMVDGKDIVPVESTDDITKEKFIGYEEERKQVFNNTKLLIEGKTAANVLLYGDAGTGKSSTVKACVNEFYSQGVRLIELRKDQLFSLSYIMGKIVNNPLKFIIFIDDLSFNKNDDCFSMLKAALEGSASAKAKNAVIYATSNRRHIVKENFSDREHTDDIHHSDTVQELMSLSDRFGLTVYFARPNKQLYLDIVHKLANKHNIEINDCLDQKAEAYALAKGSRSPRCAEQFIDSIT